MHNKKGVSEVITAVLLILLTITAIGVLWVVMQNFINASTEKIKTGINTLSIKLESAQIENTDLKLRIKRVPGQGNMTSVKVILEDETGKSDSYIQDFSLVELETKTMTTSLANFDGIDSSKIKKISVLPATKSSSGKEFVGILSSEMEVGSIGSKFVSDKGLIGYYSLNNNMKDYSGNGNDGICTISCPTPTSGKIGGGYLFVNGVNNPINVQGIIQEMQGPNGSVVAWAYPKSKGYNRYVFESNIGIRTYLQHHDDPVNGFINSLRVVKGSSSTVIDLISSTPLNQWYHLTLTWNSTGTGSTYSGTMKGYLNGLPDGENPKLYTDNSLGTSAYIGSQGNTPTKTFDGIIDEVRVYNRSLSPQEIYYLYKYN